MSAMRQQETAGMTRAMGALEAWALPDAPLTMPLQVLEVETGLLRRMLSGLRVAVPAQGN